MPDPFTMRADTRAVTIDAPVREVYDFVADPGNLPRWAVGFCRAIRPDATVPERWIVTTGQGDVVVRFERNDALGVVDFHVLPGAGPEFAAYSRVVANGAGAQYILTQFQVPGMPDSAFEAQVHTITEELQVLRALIHARAACPA
jgi:uncharacterized membrane protein